MKVRSFLFPVGFAAVLLLLGCEGKGTAVPLQTAGQGAVPAVSPTVDAADAPKDRSVSTEQLHPAAADPARVPDMLNGVEWPHVRDVAVIRTLITEDGLFASFGPEARPVRLDVPGDGRLHVERVAWLGMEGKRSGDALILVRRVGATTGLYSFYFDRALAANRDATATDSVTGSGIPFRHGFQAIGTPIDEGTRWTITRAAFVSDGIYGTHGPAGAAGVASGEPTSFLYAVWTRDSDGTGPEGGLFFARRFPIETEGALTFERTVLRLLVPAGADREAPDAWYLTQNGIWITRTPEGFAYRRFGANGITRPIRFGGDILSGEALASGPRPARRDLFGEDDGLGCGLLFFRSDAGDLRLAVLDPSAGTVAAVLQN